MHQVILYIYRGVCPGHEYICIEVYLAPNDYCKCFLGFFVMDTTAFLLFIVNIYFYFFKKLYSLFDFTTKGDFSSYGRSSQKIDIFTNYFE